MHTLIQALSLTLLLLSCGSEKGELLSNQEITPETAGGTNTINDNVQQPSVAATINSLQNDNQTQNEQDQSEDQGFQFDYEENTIDSQELSDRFNGNLPVNPQAGDWFMFDQEMLGENADQLSQAKGWRLAELFEVVRLFDEGELAELDQNGSVHTATHKDSEDQDLVRRLYLDFASGDVRVDDGETRRFGIYIFNPFDGPVHELYSDQGFVGVESHSCEINVIKMPLALKYDLAAELGIGRVLERWEAYRMPELEIKSSLWTATQADSDRLHVIDKSLWSFSRSPESTAHAIVAKGYNCQERVSG